MLLWVGACNLAERHEENDERFWLEAMIRHRYSMEEMAEALGRQGSDVARALERHGLDPDAPVPPTASAPAEGVPSARVPSENVPSDGVTVLPYPGGRHPRIGFLDGAVDPHRDTKASVFLPWPDAGYVVVDLPEAVWSGGELAYLAHTHISTMWDKKNISLERIDWTRKAGGELESRRVLPDGVAFSTHVYPRAEHVDMEMSIENGSSARITGLRTQICVLLKGAPDFNEQTRDNKVIAGRAIAARSRSGRRWIVTIWERARPWANPRCPCVHSDPVFPDLEPGESAVLRGRLFFYEGEDVEAEIERRRQGGTLEWKGEK